MFSSSPWFSGGGQEIHQPPQNKEVYIYDNYKKYYGYRVSTLSLYDFLIFLFVRFNCCQLFGLVQIERGQQEACGVQELVVRGK